jgi:SSS family solute:Na+ symporter
MSFATITLIVVFTFVGLLVAISLLASRRNAPTPDDFYLGGRGVGTVVLLMTMGATYFSTWTLLGAFGSYYRSGIWFAGFTVWTIFHALFIWLFGVRIWMAGKKFGFVTPGEMVEDYYKSPVLRILFAVVGIIGLLPYMLIQISGGAKALSGLTGDAIPYIVGVIIMSLMVGVLVLISGYRGTAWTDTFMGVFFGGIMIMVAAFIIGKAGGFNALKAVADVEPKLLTNPGNIAPMVELMLGLGLGFWVMPHMWQKYYSARSPEVLGKVSVLTPFWNSWLMALVPLLVGISGRVPGVIPGIDEKTSDQLLPLFFAHYAPLLGTVVIAGILAAGISTVNSQLLSSASLFTADLYVRFIEPKASLRRVTLLSRITVAVLTGIIFLLALTPGGSGFLIPVSALGFAIVLQLVPASLGPLYFKWITKRGAISGIIAGVVIVFMTKFANVTVFYGPGVNGFIVNVLVTVIVSLVTAKVSQQSIDKYHGMYEKYLSSETTAKSLL